MKEEEGEKKAGEGGCGRSRGRQGRHLLFHAAWHWIDQFYELIDRPALTCYNQIGG